MLLYPDPHSQAFPIRIRIQDSQINAGPDPQHCFYQIGHSWRRLVQEPRYILLTLAGQARILFVKLPYTLATEEAERIGLDHVAR